MAEGRLRRPTLPAMKRSEDDPRVGGLIQTAADDTTAVVLIGFPCDLGVARNGGRVGARKGPLEIRRALYSMTPDARSYEQSRGLLERTADLGDIAVSDDAGALAAGQEQLGTVVAEQLEQGRRVVVLGGGHETFYGHVLGHFGSGLETKILNWDAHPDVRPLEEGLPHSGSPFRQALEHPSGLCRKYTVAGLEPWCVAKAHLDYLGENRGQAFWRDQLDHDRIASIYQDERPTIVSFDLDCVGADAAPGVSAPMPNGLRPELFVEAARQAGRCKSVRSIDVVELNPDHDVDARTARLAALTVWSYLAALSSAI